jgi:hypothetical protein
MEDDVTLVYQLGQNAAFHHAFEETMNRGFGSQMTDILDRPCAQII